MAPIKFLVALSSLAILSCSFGPTTVNALSVADHHVVRHVAHDNLAKRKSGQTKRCKTRSHSSSSTSSLPNTSSSPTPSSNKSEHTDPAPPPPASTPSSSTSAPAPSKTSSSGSGGGVEGRGKLGLAWPNGDDQRLQLLITGRTGVLYTWSPDLPKDLYGLIGVPMLWGPNQIERFQQLVKPGYARHVLGFNEANEPGQSNLSPSYAAQLWIKYIQPLRDQGYKLGSPAMSSRPNGKQWMSDFLKACNGGCTFDFLATHFYDTTFEKFQAYVEDWNNAYPALPLWITEFACQDFNGGPQPDAGQVFSFYSQAMNFIEKTPWIQMAAPFGFMDDMQGVNPLDKLFNGSMLSDLGWLVLYGN